MLVQARLQNQQLRDQARELYRLRDAVTQCAPASTRLRTAERT